MFLYNNGINVKKICYIKTNFKLNKIISNFKRGCKGTNKNIIKYKSTKITVVNMYGLIAVLPLFG